VEVLVDLATVVVVAEVVKHLLFLLTLYLELWPEVAVVVEVAGSLVLVNPIIILQELLEPLTVLMDKVEAVVTELVEVEVEVAKMAVLAADYLLATTAAILEKMAIV
jgi:hypothetical protein